MSMLRTFHSGKKPVEDSFGIPVNEQNDALQLSEPADFWKLYEVYRERNESEKARSILEELLLLEMEPGEQTWFARAWYELGCILRESGESEGAQLAMIHALDHDPNFFAAGLTLSSMLCREDPVTAMEHLQNSMVTLESYLLARGEGYDDYDSYIPSQEALQSLLNHNRDLLEELEED